jgi:hypothetical protein
LILEIWHCLHNYDIITTRLCCNKHVVGYTTLPCSEFGVYFGISRRSVR